MRALEFSPRTCDVAIYSLENPWFLWHKIPSVRFYDTWKSNLAKRGRGSMTHHMTPQAPLKANNLMTMESKYGYVQENKNILIMKYLNKCRRRIYNVSKPYVMMMQIFCGIFELKVIYFHKIEISENGINRGKYDVGN